MIRWAEDSGGEDGGIWKRNMGDKGDGNTTSSPHTPLLGLYGVSMVTVTSPWGWAGWV